MPDAPENRWRWKGGRPRLTSLATVMSEEERVSLGELKTLLLAM